MTAKSIIDVEIDPEGHFKAFVALYEKWQAQLSGLGPKWEAAAEPIEKISDSQREGVAALAAQAELLHKIGYEANKADREEQKQEKRKRDAEREATRQTAARAREAKRIATETKAATMNVLKTGAALAKWVAFGGLLSFGAGALGMFGLGRLADSVGGERRSAAGLGTNIGREQAFTLNFGKLIDARGNLQKIAEAQNSLADRWAFAPFGVARPQDKDPAELAAMMAPKAKELFERGGKTQEFADAYGLTKFYSMEELRRLANTSMEEVRATARAYQNDAGPLDISDKVAKDEQNLSITIKRAERGIKAAFVTGLAPAIPELERLATTVSGLITSTLKGDKFRKFIDDAGDRLERFTTYLASDEFSRDWKSFSDGAISTFQKLGIVLDGIERGLMKLGLIKDPVKEKRLDDVAGIAVARAGGATVSGNVEDARREAMTYWMGRGYSRNAAAGLAAGEEAESGYDSTRPGDFNKKTRQYEAYGLNQWRAPRQAAFRKWAGFDIRDQRATRNKQREFLEYEMTGATGDRQAQRAGIMLRRPGISAADAADTHTRNVERPRDLDLQAASRGQLAERLAKMDLKATSAPTKPSADLKAAAKETAPTARTKTPAQAGHAPAATRTTPQVNRSNLNGTRPAVDINIRNATGGSAVVSANQVR